MLGFLQGFAYGLFLSCLPWFVIGMLSPRHAIPTQYPNRLQVIIRYWLVVPFIALLLWLTSLWGGFGPTLGGWLVGLAAIAIERPCEGRIRRWWNARKRRQQTARHDAEAARRQAELRNKAREAGVATLDPQRPPVDADHVVKALCTAKQQLLDVHRPDIAVQADRLYSRYDHVMQVLQARFDVRELTFERSRTLVREVCLGAVDNLTAMASQAGGVAGVDREFVQRRLSKGERLTAAERLALERRLALVEETERHLNDLSARNEAALTALDDTAVAMARIETGRPQASVSADQALRDLRVFIDRAEHYDRGQR
ncbi:cobyrinic acid a,c-diamide synthase [Halomonas sp. WWR20]